MREAAQAADPDPSRLYSAYQGGYSPSFPPNSRDGDAACAAYAVYLTTLLPALNADVHFVYQAAEAAAYAKAQSIAKFAPSRRESGVWHESSAEERAAQTKLLRDIFDNPFRAAPTLEPSLLHWNGGAVVRLAQAAYEERIMPSGHLDPARLAVLADALEEAGAPAALLEHLRSPGPHVRGCFAVDAVLGRG